MLVKNSAKKVKKYYTFIPAFLYVPFEHFLAQMSTKGWCLITYSWIRFTFEKASPKTRKYFIFHSGGVRSSDGKYSLTLRYGDILQSYGKKRDKSKLNSYTKAHTSYLSIIELEDDLEKEERFHELIKDRNTLYFVESIRDYILFGVLGTLLMKISANQFLSVTGGIILVFAIAYVLLSLISFLIVKVASSGHFLH